MPNAPIVYDYYQKAVFITSGSYDSVQNTPGSIVQFSRITDVGWNIGYPLEQKTYLNLANESYLSYSNSVGINVGWLHTNGMNEALIGLVNDVALTGISINSSGLVLGNNLEQETNIYITVENTAGIDAIWATGLGETKTVIGMGNCVLNSYQLSARVGGLIQSSAEFTALNGVIYSGAANNEIPAVNLQYGTQLTGIFSLPPATDYYTTGDSSDILQTVAAISANDLIMLFPTGSPFGIVFTGDGACYLQSMNVSFSINRQETRQLGYVFPPYRPILWPVHVSLSADAIVSQYQADQLTRLSCLSTGQAVSIVVKQPCSSLVLFSLQFTELQLDSQDFSTAIGSRDTISLKWQGILSNPQQTFFYPSTYHVIRADTSGEWGNTW